MEFQEIINTVTQFANHMAADFMPRGTYTALVLGVDDAILIVLIIAAVVLSIALAPKPPKPKPASITDFEVPTAEEGRPVPVVFGTVIVKGANVVWYGDLSARPFYASGGKK